MNDDVDDIGEERSMQAISPTLGEKANSSIDKKDGGAVSSLT